MSFLPVFSLLDMHDTKIFLAGHEWKTATLHGTNRPNAQSPQWEASAPPGVDDRHPHHHWGNVRAGESLLILWSWKHHWKRVVKFCNQKTSVHYWWLLNQPFKSRTCQCTWDTHLESPGSGSQSRKILSSRRALGYIGKPSHTGKAEADRPVWGQQ